MGLSSFAVGVLDTYRPQVVYEPAEAGDEEEPPLQTTD